MIIIHAVGKEHLHYVGHNILGNFILLDVHTHTHTHIYIYIYMLPVITVNVTTFVILWLILFTVFPDDGPRAETCRI